MSRIKLKPEAIPARSWGQVRINPKHDEQIRIISEQLLISRSDLISMVITLGLRDFREAIEGGHPLPSFRGCLPPGNTPETPRSPENPPSPPFPGGIRGRDTAKESHKQRSGTL